jgi:predicted SnoaL-like aldol condensation-catalyzing enzyme
MQITNKETAISFLSAYSNRNPEALDFIHPRYYQCNQNMQNRGLLGFAEKVLRQQQFATEIRPIKVIQDGDFVSALSFIKGIYSGMGVDIFRFKGNKIIEHWENYEIKAGRQLPIHLEEIAKSEIQELNKTDFNKKMAIEFVTAILISKNFKNILSFIDPIRYRYFDSQNNLCVTDTESFRFFIQRIKKQSYHSIINVIGEGNYVNIYCAGVIKGKPHNFCDLLVFQDNKIIEHRQIAAIANLQRP